MPSIDNKNGKGSLPFFIMISKRVVYISMIIFAFTTGKTCSQYSLQEIQFNDSTTILDIGDYSELELFEEGFVIWGLQNLDNYGVTLSLNNNNNVDSLIELPVGSEGLLRSFVKKYSNGPFRITSLSRFASNEVRVSCFSPKNQSTYYLSNPGQRTLRQFESLSFHSKGFTTISFSTYSQNRFLFYVFIGTDSIFPVSLNSDGTTLPNWYPNKKMLKISSGNNFTIRGRWYYQQIFIVALPEVQDSILVRIYPG